MGATMFHMVRLTAAGALLCALTVSSLAAISLQPGEWQETTTGTEDGKAVPPEVEKTCMTPEEANDPIKQMTEMMKDPSAGECQKAEVVPSGNAVTIVMKCGDPKMMSFDITGSFTFVSPTRYTGSMKSSVSMGGKVMTQDKKIDAIRIGECKPGAVKKK